MRKAVIVGTGAGGATVARELQGKYDVIILESGKSFRPFNFNLSFIEHLKKTGLFFNPLASPTVAFSFSHSLATYSA
ncbi:unnamed protein product [marine sediment metagenome]|uniref:Glucose-methanol-choline oxidoreductase N-terminal domain-containing protein n=1 Tax=marine sediment metagenome TaxID=412755 RepID=X1S501_9ZZZZ